MGGAGEGPQRPRWLHLALALPTSTRCNWFSSGGTTSQFSDYLLLLPNFLAVVWVASTAATQRTCLSSANKASAETFNSTGAPSRPYLLDIYVMRCLLVYTSHVREDPLRVTPCSGSHGCGSVWRARAPTHHFSRVDTCTLIPRPVILHCGSRLWFSTQYLFSLSSGFVISRRRKPCLLPLLGRFALLSSCDCTAFRRGACLETAPGMSMASQSLSASFIFMLSS